MTGQSFDTEALARFLANVGVDPERFERAVRKVLEKPEDNSLDHLTGHEVRVLAEVLSIYIGHFDKFYQEQSAAFQRVDFAIRSFRTEAIGCQHVFSRTVAGVNILLGAAIALLVALLALALFLAWPALAAGRAGSFVAGSCPPSGISALVHTGAVEG